MTTKCTKKYFCFFCFLSHRNFTTGKKYQCYINFPLAWSCALKKPDNNTALKNTIVWDCWHLPSKRVVSSELLLELHEG